MEKPFNPMPLCKHRFSIIKRWQDNGKFYVIQRCRKCDEWKKREIDCLQADIAHPTMTTKVISEK